MTRAEMKKEKLKKEEEFIKSLKGKKINGMEKGKFRQTTAWKTFREHMKKKCEVDALTGRKLTKTWNLHHVRFDSTLYSDLDEKYFLTLNNQIHDLLHICISETIKNPNFMKKLTELVEYHIKINDGKDVRNFNK